jgi:hypothetical protein
MIIHGINTKIYTIENTLSLPLIRDLLSITLILKVLALNMIIVSKANIEDNIVVNTFVTKSKSTIFKVYFKNDLLYILW